YFARAREVSSNYSGALLGEAGVALLKRDYSKAEKLLEDLIKSDPNRVEAYISLARVYLEENRNALAAYQAQKALDMDKFNVDAMAALCAVKIAEKKPESVRKLAKSVLELNPYNSGVRRLLSQYLNSRRAYQTKTNPEVQALINHAEQMRSLGKYEQAIVDFKQVVQLDPKSIRGWLGIGSCQLSLNDYRAAAEAADKALQMDSENALAHLQLSLAHSGMHEEARIKAEAIDWRDRYFNRATLPLPSGIEDVFVNFSTLSTNEQQVIIHAVAPLASYLSDLKRKGAKHYLLSTDKKLSEVAGYESLESRMTFDGRYYASVRGVGGLVTVSGVEYLDVTMRGGFNTIAHEFAHQVHTSAFSPELCERIKKLYQKALKNGHVLDYYASSNEWEYFAQGYEAYISMFKRPNTGVTARHTRSELQRVDPDLYDLIEELAKQDEYYKRVEKSLTVIQ
ncbi:MAG: tetratricopeptide repeat protein, partial [Blastocatellia bacterium]|nr:tetratricopeptide repeat protein [Blastocatellia bacterium]